MAEEATYFVLDNSGNTYGPADLETLKQWVADGRVLPTTNLKNVETGVTMQARFIKGLFESVPNAGAPPIQGAKMPPPPEEPVARRKKSSVGPLVAIIMVGACGFCGLIGAAILFPVFSQAKYAARKTEGLSKIKQGATALILYCADFDERFPTDMTSASTIAPIVMPYLKDSEVMKSNNPRGGQILGNPRLSGKDAMKIVDAAKIVMLYDSNPWPRGEALRAYTDGHASSRAPFESLLEELKNDPFKPAP